ncbi:MAG: hypothetical protein ACPGN3_11370 [Opitutales bacterium]
MKRVMSITLVLGILLSLFSGCGGTRYENGVKIEGDGWFGSVEPESESDSVDS